SAANFGANRFEPLRYSRIGLIRPKNPGLFLWSPRSLRHQQPCSPFGKAELASMLPGFRFLFAAILLSMSILIFGLGAAALLRAAHEEVASIPTRRSLPEPVFAQSEPAAPTLALLRVESPVAEKAPELAAAPTAQAEQRAEAVPVPPVVTERLAAP